MNKDFWIAAGVELKNLQSIRDYFGKPMTALFEGKEDAYHKYHTVSAAAAISEVPEHSAILISEEGNYMLHEKYIHEGE